MRATRAKPRPASVWMERPIRTRDGFDCRRQQDAGGLGRAAVSQRGGGWPPRGAATTTPRETPVNGKRRSTGNAGQQGRREGSRTRRRWRLPRCGVVRRPVCSRSTGRSRPGRCPRLSGFVRNGRNRRAGDWRAEDERAEGWSAEGPKSKGSGEGEPPCRPCHSRPRSTRDRGCRLARRTIPGAAGRSASPVRRFGSDPEATAADRGRTRCRTQCCRPRTRAQNPNGPVKAVKWRKTLKSSRLVRKNRTG